MIKIPKVTRKKKTKSSFFFMTFANITIEGKDKAVTPIIKARAVPIPTPFSTNASAIGSVPNISAYIGIPVKVALITEYHLSWPKRAVIISCGM